MTGVASADIMPVETEQTNWGDASVPVEDADDSQGRGGAAVLAYALVILAIGWIGLVGWSVIRASDPTTLERILSSVALACVPLALLSLIWLIFGKTHRRETERFSQAVAKLRSESTALDNVLQIVTTRLDESYAKLSGETASLMALGDEAADRLGRVTHYLSKESAALDKRSVDLESAANAARVDIGVLLNDLPKAEESARAVTEALKDAGFTAHAEAGQLEAQLNLMIAKGHEADEIVGGAAQRLASHLARIQSSAITASQHLDQAAQSMASAVDETMTRAAEAVDAARASLEAQGSATLAMIEESRTALEQAGEASGRNLSARLEQISSQIGTLARQLSEQDSRANALSGGLMSAIDTLEQRFAALSYAGGASNADLNQSIESVRATIAAAMNDLAAGQERAVELAVQAREMAISLHGVTGQLREQVGPALADIEVQADRTRGAAESLAPVVEGLQVGALDAATQVAAAEAAIHRQREALPALLNQMQAHVSEVEQRLAELEGATNEADSAAGRLVEQTGPALVEALLRVRETAAQAAERARETIASIIPESASRLADASRDAMSNVVSETMALQVEELAALSERATETARAASERLTRQMLSIGEAAAMVEARIDAARQAREEHDGNSLARRTATLIEAMNSAAVDVAKVLSNEVTDSAWAAYLKGDRGVFTRRAVRLLDGREAREIARLYETDPEFGDNVSRYVADFEAMLRRVMNERDGEALAITILSSDMGKLYVALAQAIERLRN